VRVLVCGDRGWTDTNLISAMLTGLYQEDTVGLEMAEFVVIEGHAPGADTDAHWWATQNPMHSHNEHPDDPRFEHLCFPAHWGHTDACPPGCREVSGRLAGLIRNRKMLLEGRPNLVLAFHDNLESSRGTKNMVEIAKKARVDVVHVRHV
jgi:hypothetical protein